MKNYYRFCSLCGAKLKKDKQGNLSCVRCGFVNYRNARPTATALVIWKNKLLLAQRQKKGDPFLGWWDLPGGFIDQGETAEEAMTRELKEELGISLKNKKFFRTFSGTYPSITDPFYVLTVVFIVRIGNSNHVELIDKEELGSFKWFDKKELPRKIAFDSNQKVIKEFLKIWK